MNVAVGRLHQLLSMAHRAVEWELPIHGWCGYVVPGVVVSGAGVSA